MPDLDPNRPLWAWVRVASAIIRTALEEDGIVSTEDAIRWLDALENTTLDALGDPLPRAVT